MTKPSGKCEAKRNICKVEREYVSSKFIVEFLEIGSYQLELEYSIIDEKGSEWATLNLSCFEYTVGNKKKPFV